MTPEQLDEIEKDALETDWQPDFRDVLKLVKALREAWQERDAAKEDAKTQGAMHHRYYWRFMACAEAAGMDEQLNAEKIAKIEKERDEARAEVAAAHVEAATHAARVVRLESEVRRLRVDLDEARHTIYEAKVAQGEAEQERDAAQAEMDEFAIAVGYGERPEGQSGVHRLHGEQLVDRWKQIERERDEAHAEVEQLREVVGQVHGLVESAEHDYRALIPILDKLREIRKLTKEEP